MYFEFIYFSYAVQFSHIQNINIPFIDSNYLEILSIHLYATCFVEFVKWGISKFLVSILPFFILSVATGEE